jgi:lysophospholipase L1-like esterase
LDNGRARRGIAPTPALRGQDRESFTMSQSTPTAPSYPLSEATLLEPRNGLPNFFAKARLGRPTTVAYLGGSITAANGWRPKTFAWLQQRYPQTEFTQVDAAIGGTGSDLGAYRLGYDVLSHKPDLVFVEFAVNDGGTDADAIYRQMEGIVRQIWSADPTTDICYVYTFRTGYEAYLGKGVNPPAATAHERIAEYYDIPSINVALETVRRADAGRLAYVPPPGDLPEGVALFSTDGVHPLDAGHQIYAEVVAEAFAALEPVGKAGPHALGAPFIANNFEVAKQAPITPAMLGGEWHRLPIDDEVGKHFFHRMPEIWQATTPGATLTFRYRGTLAAIYDLLGPDGGEALVTVDDQEPIVLPRFDSYCTYHRLATLRAGTDTPDGVHTVKIELTPNQPDRTPASVQEKGEYKPKKYDGTVLRFGSILVLGDMIA